MAKWLGAGAAVVLALMILLWLEMRPDPPVVVAKHKKLAAAVPEPVSAPAVPEPDAGPEPVIPPGKIDPRSDAFFEKFDEAMPRQLTRNAARCYEGRHGQLHRNQKLSLMFKTKVVNGVVSVHDVKIKESTLNDPALETCFIQEVQRSSWKDDELPDWEQDDQLVLRPERGMKKYWKDNESYVGPEAPRL